MDAKGRAILAALVALSAFAVSCGNDSNNVAGPAGGAPLSTLNLAGTWTGTYEPDNTTSCEGSAMTVILQQNGAEVAGSIASACINGGFKGRVNGNQVMGNIDMRGCTGGAFSGELSGTRLSLIVGDFYRPLLTENQVVMPGGSATLNR